MTATARTSSRYNVSLLLLALACLLPGRMALAGEAAKDAPPAEAAAPATESAPAGEAAPAEEVAKAEVTGTHCTLSVPGMHCGGCAGKVTRTAEGVEGVKSVDVRLGDHEVDIVFDETKTTPEKIRAVVSEMYDATIKPAEESVDAGEKSVDAGEKSDDAAEKSDDAAETSSDASKPAPAPAPVS